MIISLFGGTVRGFVLYLYKMAQGDACPCGQQSKFYTVLWSEKLIDKSLYSGVFGGDSMDPVPWPWPHYWPLVAEAQYVDSMDSWERDWDGQCG